MCVWAVDSYQGVGGRTAGGYSVIDFFSCGFAFYFCHVLDLFLTE